MDDDGLSASKVAFSLDMYFDVGGGLETVGASVRSSKV